jgi:hypothetical protein
MASPAAADAALHDLVQRLQLRLEPHDFYLIEQAAAWHHVSGCAGDAKQLQLLEDCRQKMKDCFHGAVFLWRRGAGDAPAGAQCYPTSRAAPDVTLLSWNILCHRYSSSACL